jgi:hypothetical protein
MRARTWAFAVLLMMIFSLPFPGASTKAELGDFRRALNQPGLTEMDIFSIPVEMEFQHAIQPDTLLKDYDCKFIVRAHVVSIHASQLAQKIEKAVARRTSRQPDVRWAVRVTDGHSEEYLFADGFGTRLVYKKEIFEIRPPILDWFRSRIPSCLPE